MSKNLVIVESPSKTKTINKYLGTGYKVLASFGHIRSIPKKSKMVDTNTFQATYELTDQGKKQIKHLVEAAKKADIIYLCTDPDREGEGIAWHLKEVLISKGIKKPFQRVVFHEITKSAILEAFKHPRDLDMNLVHAQQARQTLDYLTGFELSPLLWKAVATGTSAGRVQSPGLRLVENRDAEIKVFKPEEYWSITLLAEKDSNQFKAKFTRLTSDSSKTMIPNEEEAKRIVKLVDKEKGSVISVKKRQVSRKPKPPFTTSTLQQDAIRKLNMSSATVMSTAQKLFEAGHITYMRTDSVSLSKEAIEAVRNKIKSLYPEMLSKDIRQYQSKSANAQEAHEAIRPTDFEKSIDDYRSILDDTQFKLMELIYRRTLASQMTDSISDVTTVDIGLGDGIFRASGSVVIHQGFTAIYKEAKDIEEKDDDNQNLPSLKENDIIINKGLTPEQHFTNPPAKFNEASLVKTLEELGIGRPSTYASIISNLVNRNYITIEQKRMSVTDLGSGIIHYLTEHFSTYIDYQFTSNLEEQLDKIAKGELDHVSVLRDFYNGLTSKITQELERLKTDKSRGLVEVLDEECPECKYKLSVRLGKTGNYISCTNYPNCKYSRSMKEPVTLTPVGRDCPKCNHPLVEKKSRKNNRTFVACSNYPTCDFIEGKLESTKTDEKCPKCKKNYLFIRDGKYGPFKSCGGFPKCRYIEK